MRYPVAAILLGLGLTACGGDFDGPTPAPSTTPLPTYVQVGGNYAGTLVSRDLDDPASPDNYNCPATTTANQAAERVLFLPLVLGGACGGTSIPFPIPQVVIDTEGRIPSFPQTSAYQNPDGTCPGTAVTDGGFNGARFLLSQVITPNTPGGACHRLTLAIDLTRQ